MAPRRPISVYYAPLVYRTFPVNQAVDEVRPFRRRDPEIAAAGRKGPLLVRRPDLSLRPPCQQRGRVVRIYNYSNNTVLTYCAYLPHAACADFGELYNVCCGHSVVSVGQFRG